LTLFPLIWVLSHPLRVFWLHPGDFPQLFSPWVGEITHVFYWVVVLSYSIREGLKWKKGRGFNLAKQIIILSHAIAWYVPMVLYAHLGFYLIGVTLQILNHGIPYILLCIKYGKIRWAGTSTFHAKLFELKGILSSYFIFVLIALLAVFSESFTEEKAGLSLILRSVLIGLLLSPQLTHFFLDGFIWKPSHDAELKKYLKW
jgi:hypothetical protein